MQNHQWDARHAMCKKRVMADVERDMSVSRAMVPVPHRARRAEDLIDYTKMQNADVLVMHADGTWKGYEWFCLKKRRPLRLLPSDFKPTSYHVVAIFVSACETGESGEVGTAATRYETRQEAGWARPPTYP